MTSFEQNSAGNRVLGNVCPFTDVQTNIGLSHRHPFVDSVLSGIPTSLACSRSTHPSTRGQISFYCPVPALLSASDVVEVDGGAVATLGLGVDYLRKEC